MDKPYKKRQRRALRNAKKYYKKISKGFVDEDSEKTILRPSKNFDEHVRAAFLYLYEVYQPLIRSKDSDAIKERNFYSGKYCPIIVRIMRNRILKDGQNVMFSWGNVSKNITHMNDYPFVQKSETSAIRGYTELACMDLYPHEWKELRKMSGGGKNYSQMKKKFSRSGMFDFLREAIEFYDDTL